METQPLAFTVPEAARLLSISRTTAYDLAKAGKLRLCKIGTRTVITGNELRRFVAEVEATAAAQQVAA